jgi:hypothetical protein
MDGWVWITCGMIITRENQCTQDKTYPGVNQSTKNPKWIGLGSNMRLQGDRLATNHLTYGTAHTHVTRDKNMYFISGKM